MNTSKVITGVKAILNIANPIVVFQLAGHPDVARNPKQALTDLTNSGRALGITSTSDPRFVNEIHKCVGATLTGDLRAFKAGDEYAVTEGHPALTNPAHKAFGTVKVGDKLRADNDGVWVEGFLSIPKTQAEFMREAVADSMAASMASMFGFAPAPAFAAPATNDAFVPEGVDNQPEPEAIEAAAGKPAKRN